LGFAVQSISVTGLISIECWIGGFDQILSQSGFLICRDIFSTADSDGDGGCAIE
jgi:hypothetical protein